MGFSWRKGIVEAYYAYAHNDRLLKCHYTLSLLLDTDECSQPIPPCDQTCNNTIGSFLCGCMEGFELEPDSRTCNGKMHVM